MFVVKKVYTLIYKYKNMYVIRDKNTLQNVLKKFQKIIQNFALHKNYKKNTVKKLTVEKKNEKNI